MTDKVEVNCPLCEFTCRKDHIGRHLCRSNHISEIVGCMTPDEYNKLSNHPFIFKRDEEESIKFAVCIVCFKSFFNDGKTKEEKDEKYDSFERLHKNSKFNCFDLTKINAQREKFKKFIPVPKENRVLTLLGQPRLVISEEPKEEEKPIEQPIEPKTEEQPIEQKEEERPVEQPKEDPKTEEQPIEEKKEEQPTENKIELVYNTLESESQNDEEIEYLIEEYKKLKHAAFEREKELLDVVEQLENQIVDGKTLTIVDAICYGELEEDLEMTINQKITFLIALFRTYKKENIALNKRIQYLETILED